MKQTLIQAHSLAKSFRSEEYLFKDININLNQGDKLLVTGPNGSGKTTLLKILAGRLRPTHGKLSLHHDLITDINQYTSYLSVSELGLFERLTGLENIEFFANMLRLSPFKLEEKIHAWNEVATFKKSFQTPFYQCSSGMKQMLRCFIMTLHSPSLFIWDEPFRTLDQASCDFLIQKFWQDNQLTIIWTDHREVNNDKDNIQTIKLGVSNAL